MQGCAKEIKNQKKNNSVLKFLKSKRLTSKPVEEDWQSGWKQKYRETDPS